MKLSYVHSSSPRTAGANSLQVARMCDAFAAAGARVTLLYPGLLAGNELPADGWRRFYGVGDGFASRPLPTLLTPRLARLPGYLPASKAVAHLLEALRQLSPGGWRRGDLVYTRCFAAAFTLPRLLRALPADRRPGVVFESHEYPPDPRRARRLLEVDGVVAITHALGDELVERLGVERRRLRVAPDGVPAAWLAAVPKAAEARAALALGREHDPDPALPLVVYTGRLHAGTRRLLAATAEHLAGTATVLAVGPAAEGWGAADGPPPRHLRLHPPVTADEVRRFQVAADVLVAPYANELRWQRYTSPLKVFEYMAAQRPIVASRIPVLAEVLADGESACLVDADDAGALAAGIRRLLADPSLADRLAARARDAVQAHTWEARARAILDWASALPAAGAPRGDR